MGSAFSFVTFLGEASGIIGADVSIPHAFWTRTGVWCWPNCTAANGALAIFNSIGSPPIGYANALIIGDPPSMPILEIDDLVSGLGGPSTLPILGTLTPDSVTGDIAPPTLPGGLVMSPEPSYMAALAFAGLVLIVWQRRIRARRATGSA